MQQLTKQTLGVFWKHSIRYKLPLIVITVGVVLTVASDVVQPFFYKALFDSLAKATPGAANGVIRAILIIFALGVVHNTIWRVIGFTNNFFQPRVMSDLMNTCYEYLHKHSTGFFDNNFVGSIVTRVRRLSRSFESFMDTIYFNLGRTALRIVAIIGILLFYKPMLGVYMAIWVVIYFAFAIIFSRYKLPWDIKKADQDTKTTAHLADTVTNHMNVKLFTSYKKEVDSFKGITHTLFALRKKSWDLGQYGEMFQGFSMTILEFVILFAAYQMWKAGNLTIGDFALLQAYLADLFIHLWDIGRNIRSTYEAIADANEMTAMLIQPHAIVDAEKARDLEIKHGGIQFRNVNFHYYESQPILKDFNLEIKAGEKVAFVGKSGGGKSTIIKTLFRFVDIQGGKIEVDGQNIAEVTQESLRANISLVPQEPLLFHRSLMENIRYGKPSATDDEVIAAAKAAHCHEFIETFDKKYDTLVGERGVKLSGGERQRVAIARAILKNAPILVLDEATSSLDSESEVLIQDALMTLMKNKTTIVIAHRLSTIRKMDRIIVIEGGHIVEEGQHEELLKAEQGTYQRLWGIQVGGFTAEAAVA